jgi:hypothetical protein
MKSVDDNLVDLRPRCDLEISMTNDPDFFFPASILPMMLMMDSMDPARMTKSSRHDSHRRSQLTRDHLGNAYGL